LKLREKGPIPHWEKERRASHPLDPTFENKLVPKSKSNFLQVIELIVSSKS